MANHKWKMENEKTDDTRIILPLNLLGLTLQLRVELLGFAPRLLRRRGPPLLPQGETQMVISRRVMRVQFDGRLEPLDRAVELAFIEAPDAIVCGRDGQVAIALELQQPLGLSKFRLRRLRLTLASQDRAERVMGFRIARRQLDRRLILDYRRLCLSFPLPNVAQGVMRFGVIGPQFERGLQSRGGLIQLTLPEEDLPLREMGLGEFGLQRDCPAQ